MTLAPPEPAPLDYPVPPAPGLPRGANARQALAHDLAPDTDELLFGGARGGGKSDFVIAETLRRLFAVPGMQAVMFRRTYVQLSRPGGLIPRLLARIPKNLGSWNGSNHVWTFRNGSTLTLSYLRSLGDATDWMGLELQLMVFDQLEQIEGEVYEMVRTSLRVSGPVAEAMKRAGYRPASLATANPGNIGHSYVKARFIDPFPHGGVLFRPAPTPDEPEPGVRLFVPSKLSDNPALEIGDPGYRRRLEGLDPIDRAAQLEGDWNVYKGARFSEFRTDRHVAPAAGWRVPLGASVPRGAAVDYGIDNPFVCLWGYRDGDTFVIYREVDATGLTPREQARTIRAATAEGEWGGVRPRIVLDPACWAQSPDHPVRGRPVSGPSSSTAGGPVRDAPPPGSIADTYRREGLPVRRADNRRLEGAALIADLLKVRRDGRPRLVILDTCPNLIRTLPLQMRDPKRPEDYRKNNTDHWTDTLRYLLMDLRDARIELDPSPGAAARRAEEADHAARTRATGGLDLPPVAGLRRRGF